MEAYEALLKLKMLSESFSDVMMRLIKEKQKPDGSCEHLEEHRQ
ncbi:MAG: antitoxin VapB family protein [Desulfurococcales archaeon]